MELQILVSKKGTRVVTATSLHKALQLPAHRYNAHVEKWLSDVYAFKDDVRAALNMRDFAQRNFKYSKLKDYYISLEMATLITLNSTSPVKKQYAKYLMAMDNTLDTVNIDVSANHTPDTVVNPNLLDRASTIPQGAQLGLW